MIRRPPRSTRTDTLFPYTTLFRSLDPPGVVAGFHGLRVMPSSVESVTPFQPNRSEEHTSELQSLMRISYAVFCLKKKKRFAANKSDAIESLGKSKLDSIDTLTRSTR